jgi:hypothetical protein
LISIASDSEAPEYSTASTPARNSTSISGALGSATPGSERHSTKQNGFISWSVSRIARATVMLRTKRREGPGREGGREGGRTTREMRRRWDAQIERATCDGRDLARSA